MSYAHLSSKLTRAVRAVLLDQSAGTAKDTFAVPSSDSRDILPNTTIDVGDPSPDAGPGNWRFTVIVRLRDPGIAQASQGNPNVLPVAAATRFSLTHDALNRSEDGGASLVYTRDQITTKGRLLATTGSAQERENNADMAQFTCLWWEFVTMGSPERIDAESVFWEQALQFSAIACNAAIN